MNPTYTFGELLRQYRSREKTSQLALAEAISVNRNTIINWEKGDARPDTREKILAVAGALSLSDEDTDQLLFAAQYPLEFQTPLAPAKPAPFQAIARVRYFAGRETQLKQMMTMLQNGEWVTVSGMGGVGKTSLATEIAYRLKSHFVDGVLWADVATTDTLMALTQFASAFDEDVGSLTDLASRSSQVRSLLAGKRILLIIDNATHSEQVNPLLPPNTGSEAVLVTTRHDLAIADTMQQLALRPFANYAAGAQAIFQQFLGADLVKQHQAELAQMAALVGQLPLAIALIAGQLARYTDLTISDFLAALRESANRLNLLKREDQSVRLAFDASFQHLPPGLQTFFARLGAFGGDHFSAEAVAYVADISQAEAINRLRQLAGLSLAQIARPDRYTLHPLIRDYAIEKLESDEAPQRMARYFLDYVQNQTDTPTDMSPELSNINHALDVALQQKMVPDYIGGVIALAPLWKIMGELEVSHTHLKQALAFARQDNHHYQQIHLLTFLGINRWTAGQYQAAIAYNEGGITLARQVEDAGLLSQLMLNQGVIAGYNEADYAKAERLLAEALAYARQAKNHYVIEVSLLNLGNVYHERGERAQAQTYWQEAIAFIEEKGTEASPNYVRLLRNMGVTNGDQGNFSLAAGYFTKALEAAKVIHYAEQISANLSSLGWLAYEQHDFSKANALLQEALAIGREKKIAEAIALALCRLGSCAIAAARFAAAQPYLDEALEIAERAGINWLYLDALIQQGDLHLAQGKVDEASQIYAQVIDHPTIGSTPELQALALFGLAQASLQKDQRQAIDYARQALATLQFLHHFKAKDVSQWLQDVA